MTPIDAEGMRENTIGGARANHDRNRAPPPTGAPTRTAGPRNRIRAGLHRRSSLVLLFALIFSGCDRVPVSQAPLGDGRAANIFRDRWFDYAVNYYFEIRDHRTLAGPFYFFSRDPCSAEPKFLVVTLADGTLFAGFEAEAPSPVLLRLDEQRGLVPGPPLRTGPLSAFTILWRRRNEWLAARGLNFTLR